MSEPLWRDQGGGVRSGVGAPARQAEIGERALAAIERLDFAELRQACDELGSERLRDVLSEHGWTLVLYEILRTAGETLGRESNGEGRAVRRHWIGILGAAPDATQRHAAFIAEIDRLTAPFLRKQPRLNPMVLRALRFIETHATESISLSRVAREVGLARNYMSSLFHRETGVTMTEYIHRVRIRRAVALLQGGSLSMNEVARLVGYGSYRHFHRRFSRLLAVSPTTYQRTPGPGWPEAISPQLPLGD